MDVVGIKPFSRFQRKERIENAALLDAIARAADGLIDADLGGGLITQRVARDGQGKSGGWRMIIAYRAGDRAVFLSGFAKSRRDNIDDDEIAAWRKIGESWLAMSDAVMDQAIKENKARRITR